MPDGKAVFGPEAQLEPAGAGSITARARIQQLRVVVVRVRERNRLFKRRRKKASAAPLYEPMPSLVRVTEQEERALRVLQMFPRRKDAFERPMPRIEERAMNKLRFGGQAVRVQRSKLGQPSRSELRASTGSPLQPARANVHPDSLQNEVFVVTGENNLAIVYDEVEAFCRRRTTGAEITQGPDALDLAVLNVGEDCPERGRVGMNICEDSNSSLVGHVPKLGRTPDQALIAI